MAKLSGVKIVDMTAGEVTKVAYEGAEYVRVETPQVGDIGRFAEDTRYGGQFTEILGLDEDGDVMVCGGHGHCWYTRHLEYFRKVDAQDPTIEARVGKLESDVAALKGEQGPAPKFKAGDKVRGKLTGFVYTLLSRFPEKDSPTRGLAWRIGERCNRVDWVGENQVELVEEKPLAVGDYAKVVSIEATEESRGIPDVKVGQIVYLIGESDTKSSKGFKVETVDHNKIVDNNVVVDDLIRATDEEVVEAKAAMKPKLTVGDYAKVVGETYHGDFCKGTVVKIAKNVDEDGDYKIELLDGSDYDYAQVSSLEKVDADKAETIDKWAKIGREVDEYKEGDIVTLPGPFVLCSAGEVDSVGEVLVVRRFDGGFDTMSASKATLIAPVESRVDR
ncbi:hypothetical protein J26TS2_00340 [Shouchella clausii]|nr:hypothetical protein J26TS2_00340 [Shouchella clausii]